MEGESEIALTEFSRSTFKEMEGVCLKVVGLRWPTASNVVQVFV